MDQEVIASVAQNWRRLRSTQQLLARAGKRPWRLKGAHRLTLLFLIKALIERERGEKQARGILVLTPSPKESLRLVEQLKEVSLTAVLYSTLALPELKQALLPEVIGSQIQAQKALASGGAVVVASIADLVVPGFNLAPGPRLAVGESADAGTLLEGLIELGFRRSDLVAAPLEVALRGDLLELFEPGADLPLRFEFLGNKIEKISLFDPISKLASRQLREIELTYWREGDTLATHLTQIENKPIVFLLEPDRGYEVARQILLSGEASQQALALANRVLESCNPIEIGGTDLRGALDLRFKPLPLFAERWEKLFAFLEQHNDFKIFFSTRRSPHLLEKMALEHGLKTPPQVHCMTTQFEQGFIQPELKVILLTDHELYLKQEEKRRSISQAARGAFLTELKIGDLVVHQDHGIGILKAFEQMRINGVTRDYLVIEYADQDKLFVPFEQIDKVVRFIHEGGGVKLHRLSGEIWKKTLARVKKDTLEFARQLLELYAQRAIAQGEVKGGEFYEEALAATFAHEETADQEKAIQEINEDLKKGEPMDRLLVADVGFGKTEVAIRAAFQAVSSGFQVAVLVPTTILVEQHLKTFKERLKPFGTKIAALSRFQSQAKQKEIVEKLKTHQIDLIIGTHRLLSRDVGFAKLGLAIIDEEQRFGVKQKERLKSLRSEVDVLSMTATPIPRTLNFALSGIRNITVMETPPAGRMPIETQVAPLDWQLMKEAILQEVGRGGQVYFVHNRVRTIASIKYKLETLLPEVKFVAAHGQMPERQLQGIMERFYRGEFDVLVASTIIENGLDNPRVNTLIIDEAGRFGLSQLHQLRGRIGRGNIQAYAYFFYKPGTLSAKMAARLKTIAEETQLGAGMDIALRDMKLRGTGGILSTRQHGQIASIGLPMYLRLLQGAIEEVRTGLRRVVDTVTIDLPVSAFIPATFINQESQRIKLYQKLSLMTEIGELKALIIQLEKEYGVLPDEFQNLLEIVSLKIKTLKTQLIKSIRAVSILGKGSHLVIIELIKKIKKAPLPGKLRVGERDIKLPLNFLNPKKAIRELSLVIEHVK